MVYSIYLEKTNKIYCFSESMSVDFMGKFGYIKYPNMLKINI